MKHAIRRLLDPKLRRSLEAKARSAPLRSWSDVARETETVIIERRPPSDPA